ncbi:MAG: type II toxin-antitoxin system VapC family toxin [Planctomycetes bacterium]|nr:type II toxin-antitoxin system VapC family toxin [Planctomycetota bacterium]
MFIFDTDHLGIIQWQSEPEYSRLMLRVAQHAATDYFVTIVSFHEEILGWNAYIAKAKKIDGVIKGYGRLLQILTDFSAAQVLAFDDAAAARFVQLHRQKIRISTMDLRIASIAVSRSMTLLSRNLTDFRRVPSLDVHDWTT